MHRLPCLPLACQLPFLPYLHECITCAWTQGCTSSMHSIHITHCLTPCSDKPPSGACPSLPCPHPSSPALNPSSRLPLAPVPSPCQPPAPSSSALTPQAALHVLTCPHPATCPPLSMLTFPRKPLLPSPDMQSDSHSPERLAIADDTRLFSRENTWPSTCKHQAQTSGRVDDSSGTAQAGCSYHELHSPHSR